MKTHGKGLAHSCTGYLPCTEQFRKKTQLERHVRVEHLGVRGWVCRCLPEVEEGGEGVAGEGKRCEECFETKGQLSRHMKREHGTENKYFCEDCTIGKDGEVVGRSSATTAVRERVTVVGSPEHEVPSESKRVSRSASDPNKELDDLETLLRKFLKNAGDSDSSPDSEMDESQDQSQGPPDPATTTDTTNTNTTTALATATTPSFTSTSTSTSTLSLAQPLGFKTLSSYQHHLLISHPPIGHDCGTVCLSHQGLRVYVDNNHAPEHANNNICPYAECNGKRFTRKWTLTVHIKTVHEGEKNHICPQEGCGRAFGHKGSMEEHSKKHFRALERTRGQQRRREAGQAEVEVGRGEVMQGEVGQGQVGKGEVTGAGQADVAQAEAGQTQEGQAENWQAKVGQAAVGEAEVGEAEVWQAEVGQAEAGKTEVGQAEVGQAEVGQAAVGQVAVGQVAVGQAEVWQGGREDVSAEESSTLRHNTPCMLDECEYIWYGLCWNLEADHVCSGQS